MQRFALWLCRDNMSGAQVDRANLRVHMSSSIEADWLDDLLSRKDNGQPLRARAQQIADLLTPEKRGLEAWIREVANLGSHFGPTQVSVFQVGPPNGWTRSSPSWSAFGTLMVAFYEPGLRDGLPYQANGTPTAIAGQKVTYRRYVDEFRAVHQLDAHPDAREACVLCDGELRLPAVDHWVRKSSVPLLAVCADNLLPICGECNQAPAKGQKDVHTNGRFEEWFHPFLRHANGELHPRYDPASFAVRVDGHSEAAQRRARRLDDLLKLGERWTREFKAEYRKLQREVDQRRARGRVRDLHELRQFLLDYRASLTDQNPNYAVHRVVAYALLEPTRMQALLATPARR